MNFRIQIPRWAAALAGAVVLTGGSVGVAVGGTTPEGTQTSTPGPTTPVPAVVVGAAKDVTASGVTLAGRVNGYGSDVTAWFEYGPSSAYGVSTAAQQIEVGHEDISQAITGLAPRATYHYRLVASSASGIVSSADRTFKTVSLPKIPSVAPPSATRAVGQSLSLVGRVNPQGQPTSYYFEYGITAKLGIQTPVVQLSANYTTASVSATLSGLAPATKYFYRLVASNAAGVAVSVTKVLVTDRNVTDVTLSISPLQPRWGVPASIVGAVRGAGAGGVTVVLYRQEFPYDAPFVKVSSQVTSNAGGFTFPVAPLRVSARFRVSSQSSPVTSSSVLQVKSELKTSIQPRLAGERRHVRLRGEVRPAVPRGRAVLERRGKEGRWVRVKNVRLRPAADHSSFLTSVRRASKRVAYRISVSPRDAGAHVTTLTRVVSIASL